MKILAYEVESTEEFCGSPLVTQKVWEMKLGRNYGGLWDEVAEGDGQADS
jgi:hypothetical protein